jgi:hypothetical protein
MGHKITRQEELARHAFRRDLVRAIRGAAKGTGWRTIEGLLFRDHRGWFVQVWPSVMIYWRETVADMKVKPTGCDPIFWDLLEMPENNIKPLSFRALGAWTCRPAEFERASISEGDMDASATARRVLEWAEGELEKAQPDLNIDRFIRRLQAAREQKERGRLISTLVTTLLMAGRDDEAEQVCIEAIERGQNGGFFPGAGTFPIAALESIRARRKRPAET